jgi:ATPase family associated with various cellular activities (AAA)/Winged helix domain, variant
MSGEDWTTANQRVLVAEFARLKARLAGDDTTPADRGLSAARAALPADAAIDALAGAFRLSAFERDVLLLCAGVEMDGKFASLCATSAENAGKPFATFGLALATLADPHWNALTPIGPLRLWRLLEVRDDRALTSSRLCIDERVLHFLVGLNYLDTRLRSLLHPHATAMTLAEDHAAVVEPAIEALASRDEVVPVVQLIGDDAAAQTEVARRVSAGLGVKLHVLRSADIPAARQEADALALLWHRESVLLGSALLVQIDGADAHIIARFVEGVDGLVFVAAREPVTLRRADRRFRIDRPHAAAQKRLWNETLGGAAVRLNGTLDSLAAHFRLPTDSIVRAAQAVRTELPAAARLDTALWCACRESARGRLDDLAQRVETVATWADLVIPETQFATLQEIAAHVRQRMKVYEEWGFAIKSARGLGISALFCGESGTGKTMAAEVLANELHLDLYRIDLASMVSKYIGETEKNLRRVFDAAEDGAAILLFDEADALFGKRSDVNDSHDRYANIEISYLLQRMEAYRGLAILTTNLKRAIDTAFQRRLRFVVQFPFPDAELRECIWRGVFPRNVPLAAIDHRKLAQLNVAGGTIRNIALNAAFLAAEADESLGMGHLLHAARSDAAKRERPFSDAETRGWA